MALILHKPDRGSVLAGEGRRDINNDTVADGHKSSGVRGDRKLLRYDTEGPGAALPGG